MRLREVRTTDRAALSAQDLVGQRIASIDISGAPSSCVFRFGRATLQVESFWRLVSDRNVTVTGSDHGQMFGHETPVDASSRILAAVGDRSVTATRLGPVTGDLTIEFGPLLLLQLIVESSGYESWRLSRADGSQLVATSGGRVALFRPDAG
jgi:hypothetical protein